MKYTEIKEYNKDIQFEIGQRIQGLRISKGIAGIDMAACLNIGKNQLSRIENGRASCTMSQIYILVQILECSLEYLLFGIQTKTYTQEQEYAIKAMREAFSLEN